MFRKIFVSRSRYLYIADILVRAKQRGIKKGRNSMWILLWIIFGAIVGWVASLITGNNARMGILLNIVVGLIGAVIGGWISTYLGFGSYNEFSLGSFAVALGGAVLLLLIVNLFSRRRG